jgi:hypothetical protein
MLELACGEEDSLSTSESELTLDSPLRLRLARSAFLLFFSFEASDLLRADLAALSFFVLLDPLHLLPHSAHQALNPHRVHQSTFAFSYH